MNDSKFKLDQLFEGALSQLRTEARYFSTLTSHNPELGRLNESHLVSLLRSYLPPKFGIGTGFIVCGGPEKQQSPQCDIIIFDAVNNAPLYASDSWSIFPVEMVYAVIEVKTRLNRNELDDAIQKCAAIRSLAKNASGKKNKHYLRRAIPLDQKKPVARYTTFSDGLPPRFYIFGYSGWQTEAALKRNFEDAWKQNKKAHIHGICNLTKADSIYIKQLAFTGGQYKSVSKSGFRHFMLEMPKTLDSMLPRSRNGLGFDLIDIERY